MVVLLNKVEDSFARSVCERWNAKEDALLEILHEVQGAKGFLSDAALRTIANTLNISRAEIHGVVSFYHDFKRKKQPDQCIKICRAEACQAVGCDELIHQAENFFGVEMNNGGDDISLEATYCLGNCALGPAVMIDDNLYGRVDIERLKAISAKHSKVGSR
ncbi:MAG: hypothetical protein COA43_08300 [Robiginitomaculum sp.]|nr:MAG: hypothetical protein COA43_08300 [Robiginitomaculum sp.]